MFFCKPVPYMYDVGLYAIHINREIDAFVLGHLIDQSQQCVA